MLFSRGFKAEPFFAGIFHATSPKNFLVLIDKAASWAQYANRRLDVSLHQQCVLDIQATCFEAWERSLTLVEAETCTQGARSRALMGIDCACTSQMARLAVFLVSRISSCPREVLEMQVHPTSGRILQDAQVLLRDRIAGIVLHCE